METRTERYHSFSPLDTSNRERGGSSLSARIREEDENIANSLSSHHHDLLSSRHSSSSSSSRLLYPFAVELDSREEKARERKKDDPSSLRFLSDQHHHSAPLPTPIPSSSSSTSTWLSSSSSSKPSGGGPRLPAPSPGPPLFPLRFRLPPLPLRLLLPSSISLDEDADVPPDKEFPSTSTLELPSPLPTNRRREVPGVSLHPVSSSSSLEGAEERRSTSSLLNEVFDKNQGKKKTISHDPTSFYLHATPCSSSSSSGEKSQVGEKQEGGRPDQKQDESCEGRKIDLPPSSSS